MPTTKTKPKPAVTSCLMIQWSPEHFNEKGKSVCPRCGKPAEQVLGMIGVVYAHKSTPRRRKK